VTGEEVLVVPRAVVPDHAGWHGLRTEGLDAFIEEAARHGRFLPRVDMETDPSFKQLIPYLVLRDGPRTFLMRRTTAGGDARLHDRWSIGVGGHLNPGDVDLVGGLRREWREELEADWEPRFEPLALLNDDTTDVGSVHLGVVFLAEAEGRPVAVRETEKLEGRFADPDAVDAVADRLETWSAIVWAGLRDGTLTGAAAGGPEDE
jgi:predicted NUDIX family phosphoesterase